VLVWLAGVPGWGALLWAGLGWLGVGGALVVVVDRMREEAEARGKAEAEALREQLRQAQKMDAIGRLAGGVAHDFNNLLTVIQGNVELLLEAPELAPERRRELEEIQLASGRAAGMTQQLLVFGRASHARKVPMDLGAAVREMLQMLGRLVGEQVTIEAEIAGSIPLIEADPSMIDQILVNLAVNARDAMPEGGVISVRVFPAPFPASGACLSVSDTGEGILPEHLQRIFDPFFTTKGPGRGTGLGLATVHGIVQQHDGVLSVESTPGNGATFLIQFPATLARISVSGEVDLREAPRGHETLLLVEDDAGVRLLTRTILERQGYRVHAVGSGVEALELWSSVREEVALLVTDLMMPGGVSGHELVRRLRREKPDLRVVFTSGYDADPTATPMPLVPGKNFLSKPYSKDSLTRLVRRRLDDRRHPSVAP
jgi:hypothetical protein